jgi:hypothetical protein
MAAKTGAAAAIRKLSLRHPELTHSEIARTVGCSATNVTGVLETFLGTYSRESLQDFQENKAEVYDALQRRVLGSITDAKIEKAGLTESVTAAAILEDKARLVRGQATGINVNVLMDVVAAIKARQQ